MIPNNYIEHCQALWSSWLSGTLAVSPLVAERFQLDHAPEPYLRFGDGNKPLYFLFTNPGAGMEHQLRTKIAANDSCVTATMTYGQAAKALAEFYDSNLTGAAKTRIDAMKSLSNLAGFGCAIQFESIPFHSANLPGKRKLPDFVDKCSVLSAYAEELSQALQHGPLITLSAVGTNAEITVDLIRRSPWLSWQASMMGLDLDKAQVVSLLEKNGKTTCGVVYQREEWTTGLVLMMGGNHFPAKPGLERLAELFV